MIILSFGCIIKQSGHVNSNKIYILNEDAQEVSVSLEKANFFNFNLILILVQILSAAFAGVYNEYLLKDTDKSNVHIMIQNTFMYVNSIVCNILLLIGSNYYSLLNKQEDSLSKIFSYESLAQVMQFKVIIIILNNAAIGIVTSLFLKSLNSILKAFAGALELMLTAVLSWIIFGIPLDRFTIVAFFFVTFSTWLYSRNPVHNPPKMVIKEVNSKTVFTNTKA